MTPTPTFHVCIPTLKRYDLLRDELLSIQQNTVRPAFVHIIDNGKNHGKMSAAVHGIEIPLDIFTPSQPLGLAAAWNWFIRHTPSTRLICNDDLVFSPEALADIVTTPGDFVSALPGSNACSCFLLRDTCVEKVGYFDETISPGYAYFEDCDYIERMIMQGIPITPIAAGVVHMGSQTIAMNSGPEWEAHHAKFSIAQNNFIAKWGRTPYVPGPHWPKA